MIKKSLLLTLLLALLVPWAANAQETLTVYGDNTTTNEYVPIYGYYADSKSKCEFIIPSEKISAMNGSAISAMKFYLDHSDDGSYYSTISAPFEVFVKEVSATTFSAFIGDSGATTVFTGTITIEKGVSNIEIDIPFSSDYIYGGGNLLVGFYQTTTTGYNHTYWTGETQTTNTAWGGYVSSASAKKFLPKTTFTYELITTPTITLPASATVTTGFTTELTATLMNVTGTPTITYSSSNTKVASVTGSGTSATVTGESAGTATITATMVYNATSYYASCDVTVEDPSYCTPTFDNPSDDYIANFATTGGDTNIDNTTTYETGGYSNYYEAVSASIQAGETLSCTVTPSSTSYAYGHAIWVDWNKNYEFEASERVAYSTDAMVGNWTGEFEVPVTTAAGDYRLRVLHVYNGTDVTEPCMSTTYGEGEDYKLTVTAASPYQKPVNLQLSTVTATTATLTWEAPNSDVQSYKYQYREEGGTWTDLTTTTALSAPLTVLTENTTYEFQVQAIYAGNNESAFASISFTTECNVKTIPYTFGFETAEIAELNCWTIIDEYGRTAIDDGTALTSASAHTGNNFFAFTYYNYPDTDPQYMTLISPEITGIVSGLHVEFYYLTDGQSTYPETFRVGYSTTNKNLSSFTWVNTITDVVAADYELFKANYPANAKYIAVQHLSDDMDYLILDDFSFTEAPSCVEPSGLLISSITTTGAALSWTAGGAESAWDIYVTDDITDVPNDGSTPTYAAVTSNTNYPISGLTSGTIYYVYLRSACDATTHSDWTMPTPFTTECEAISLPYQYDFEDDALPVCWNTIGTNSGWITSFISASAPQHGSKHFVIQTSNYATGTQYVVLPEVDANYPLNEYQITFYSKLAGYSTTGRTLAVGVMTDPTDASTFVQMGDAFTPTSDYAQYKVRFNTYTGNGQYIAIKHNITSGPYSASYTYIDNLEVNPIPSCIEPTGLAVTAPTPHGATFSWTAGGSETEWHLYFGKDATAPADDINLKEVTVADSNPFTLTTGLDAETNYYAWVRANCGGTDGYSMWVGPETFTTGIACPAPTGLAASEITGHTAKLSWTGTSDSYKVSYRTAASVDPVLTEDFENETHYNNNWTVVNLSTANTPGRNSNAGHNSSYGFRFSSYNSASTYEEHLINTNELTGLTNGVIEFYYKKTNSSTETFAVGYSSTDKETTSFSFGANVTATTSWQLFHEEIPAGTKYVSIKYTTTGCYYYIYIDDIVIGNVIPAGTWETKTADASPYVATGLLAETKYEAKVQGNCGSEGLSQESASIFFITDVACPAPTGFALEDRTSSTATLNWNEGADAWQVEVYNVTDATPAVTYDISMSEVTVNAGVVTYTLNDLTPEKEYTLKLRADCTGASDGYSEWAVLPNFTTLAACSAMNPVVSNIGHFTATVNWDGESTSGYTVKYREAAHIDGISEDFSGTSIPTNWTMYTGLVDNVIAGSVTLATTSYGWTMTTASPNVFNSNHIRLNIYGSSRYHWLVTPEINLPANSELSFDLALTAYASNGNSTSAASGTCDDERFVVLIFANNAWEILREWNNDGTGDAVYNDIATAGENVNIDLSSYSGTVKIAFYGESTTSGNGDNDMHLDNVTIGVNVPAATTWQTQAATTTTADLTGLTAGTKYDLKVVPNCDETIESNTVQFTTVSGDTKYFLTEGNWGTAANWEPTGAPTLKQNVTLFANATIESGCVAEAKNITQGTYTITIEDGGQLKHDNSGVTATVKKNISAYPDANEKSGYYLISSPLSQTIYKHTSTSLPNISSTGLLTGDYDLYTWAATNTLEWSNYEASPFDLSSYSPYKGYLYANANDVELTFTGTIRPSSSYVSSNATYSTSYEFGAFNLFGNPYVCDAYLVSASTNGTALAYYKMNDAGDDFEAVANGTAIKPMQGFFYEASASGYVYMVRTAPAPVTSTGNLNIYVAQVVTSRDAHRSTDNAIIRFGEGNTLQKFSFNEANAKVYIPQDNKDYAVVNAEAQGEMPVNFKAAENGTYTISFNSENTEFRYLHLIDNMTGADINLLETPSYTFDARYTDYASRFKLVFATGSNGSDDNFGFISDGNLLIPGIEGEATVQVIDVTGRILSSETFSGNYSKAVNGAAGVYMIRLIQGENVRTQKIVVK